MIILGGKNRKLILNLKNEIVIFENREVKVEVHMKDETIWLNF
jgi:hypothetical protein